MSDPATAVADDSDRWAAGRELLRAADPRMAALVEADPEARPRRPARRTAERPVGRARAAGDRPADLARGGRRDPRPARRAARRPAADAAELLDIDAETLRSIGLSRAKAIYLHDLAARLEDGRLDLERLRALDDDAARDRAHPGQGRRAASPPTACSCSRCAGPTSGPPPTSRSAGRSSGSGSSTAPASIAEVDALGERFRPWRTLAAAYLYRSSPG